MINWVEAINSPWFRMASLVATFVLGMAFNTWLSRSKDDGNVWDDEDLSEDEDVYRIQEGFAADTEVAISPVVPSWNYDSGATAYLQLRELQEPERRFYATPVPATAVMTFDPERPTGIPHQAYAPVSHRLPEGVSNYRYRVQNLVEDTTTLSKREIKELVDA